MFTIAGNKHFHNIQMKTIWKMVETCIIPIITYAGETRTPNKTENKQLNNILDNIIKRILMVPRTTPREVLYIETGLMDIEHITQKNRINMEKRINSNPTSLTFKVKEKGAKHGWNHNTEKIRNKWNITDQDMDGTSQQVKNMIKEK